MRPTRLGGARERVDAQVVGALLGLEGLVEVLVVELAILDLEEGEADRGLVKDKHPGRGVMRTEDEGGRRVELEAGRRRGPARTAAAAMRGVRGLGVARGGRCATWLCD